MSDVLGPGQDPEVERLIEARRYREAVDLLSPQLPEDSEGRLHALAAVAHYGLEEYQEAAANYELALERAPANGAWQEMLMQSRANAVAEVNVYVPELSYFDRDALLARPVVRDGSLPAAPMDAPTPGLSGKLRLLIGNVGGAVVSSVMSGMTQALGRAGRLPR